MAKSKFERDPKRSEQEKAEGLAEVKDMNAPKERFQREQQVSSAVEAKDTTAGKVDYSKKVVKPAGAELKQAAVSKVLTSAAGSASSAEAVGVSSPAKVGGVKTLAYSGTDGTILGSAAGTPIVAKDDRASSRFGKKMDATNKKINYIASEQVIVDYVQPKPLAEDDGVQGYNGTPKNTSARLQKCSGTTPADLMYDRSIDEVTRDELVFVSGQQVKTNGVNYIEGPTLTYDPTVTGSDSDKYVKFNITRGDYLPDHLEVKIKKAGGKTFVSSFKPITINCSTGSVPPKVAQLSGTNAIIDMNCAEIDRQGIDNKAGIETNPDWCPLGRAVKQPTQTVAYLRDLEQMTGAEIFASYKFANKALAYQLNKASKDGMDTVGPRNEMLVGLVAKHISSKDYDGIDPFAPKYERAGAASLMIDIFDSKVKYKNKADVLTQPRSLKMHLQTADNNINVFRVKPEFVAALNSVDVFSTIDRGYDAMGPVYLTDCVKLVHPYGFNDLFSYTSADGIYENRVWSSSLFRYMYKNRMSRYVIKAAFPLMAGISYWFDLYAPTIYDKVHTGDGDEVTINIPIVHSTRHLSFWDFLVCSAVPYIQVERTNALKDILDYEVSHEYPFHQLKDLGSLNPMNAVNYTCTSRDEPLQVKEMLPSAALSWIMPEVYSRLGMVTETKGAINSKFLAVLLPHYFTEGQFSFGAPSVNNEGKVTETTPGDLADWAGVMSYPVTRAGATNGFLNDVYGMSERDYRLTLDRQVVPVGYLKGNDYRKYTTYKHSQSAEGQVIMRVNVNKLNALTAADYIATPRELGWFMVAPEGVCQPARLTDDDKGVGATIDFNMLNTSYRCRVWENAAASAVTASTSSLDAKSVVVNRAQNFIQRWIERIAVNVTANNSIHNAVILSIRDAFALDDNGRISVTDNIGKLDCETTGTESTDGLGQVIANLKLINLSQILYNRIQKFAFILNPFDSCADAVIDPYDFGYMFNLAGFMESDYNEDVYNRINQAQNQGWLYTKDPFVADSVVFKDAVRLTEI